MHRFGSKLRKAIVRQSSTHLGRPTLEPVIPEADVLWRPSLAGTRSYGTNE